MVRLLQAGVIAVAVSGLVAGAQSARPTSPSSLKAPVMLPTHGIKKPKLIYSVNAWNPEVGKVPNSVTVVVQYTVGVDGRTHDIHVVKGKDAAFDEAAMHAIARYLYLPASEKGVAVPVVLKRSISFNWDAPYNPCSHCTDLGHAIPPLY